MNNRDLLKQYVDTGVCIGQHQVSLLRGNLLETYLRKRKIAIFNGGNFIIFEFALLGDFDKKKYLSLLIKREETVNRFLLSYCNEDVKSDYLDEIIRVGDSVSVDGFGLLSDKLKLKFLAYSIDKGFNSYGIKMMLDVCSPELQDKYREMWIASGKDITNNAYWKNFQ